MLEGAAAYREASLEASLGAYRVESLAQVLAAHAQ
jgi:hypothetical protein